MFKQLKNIDTVARLQRLFNIVLMLVTAVVLCFGIYKSYDFADKAQNKVHILYNGKVLAAFTSDRKTNLPVELRDHIKTFHEDFFTLAPDDGQIDTAIRKALYLSDNSAKRVYDNLKEANYFNNLISGNINQQITVDSIGLDMNAYPWAFTCFATEKLIRATSTVRRRLVTTGKVSDLKIETDRNPHGFLIQGWEILENNDIPQSK
ncbi:conjugative transposon protein TraK [Mucilaginibacter sp. R-33]|uniref:conjugative transposon protein TraK n=1 Tax=Mucilaginibacter sp. R-33 TaxID=3416711 RepID=UPI003CE80613